MNLKIYNNCIIVSTVWACIDTINESTAGADASVEVPKLHNIKLLIASFYYTHIDYDEFCNRIVGNDRP